MGFFSRRKQYYEPSRFRILDTQVQKFSCLKLWCREKWCNKSRSENQQCSQWAPKAPLPLLPTPGIFMICSIFSQLFFLPHLFLLSVKQVPQVSYYWQVEDYCQDKSYPVEASQKGQIAQISVRNPDQALCQAAFGLGKQLRPGLHPHSISSGDCNYNTSSSNFI